MPQSAAELILIGFLSTPQNAAEFFFFGLVSTTKSASETFYFGFLIYAAKYVRITFFYFYQRR